MVKYDRLVFRYLINGRVAEIYGREVVADSGDSDRSGRGNKRISHGVLPKVGKSKEKRDRRDKEAEQGIKGVHFRLIE